jgi:plastocyanin
MRRPGVRRSGVRRSGVAALVAVALTLAGASAAATSAAAAELPVMVEFQSFAPTSLDALAGDTVTWMNHSGRRHTVTADDGQFDSGDLNDGGEFSQTFTSPGEYLYHCTVHRGMIGEVDVRRVTLDPLPPALVRTGSRVDVAGRTSNPDAPVLVEADTGKGFRTVATASPGADGSWKARVTATGTATYRAVVGADMSETRRLLVSVQRVQVHATAAGVSVRVVPAAPYGRVALQLYLRARFGWWPTVTKRLDYLSQTTFRLSGPVRARVALLDRDGWTALALSPAIRIPRH